MWRCIMALAGGVLGASIGVGFTALCVVVLVPASHPPVLSWPAMLWAGLLCAAAGGYAMWRAP